MIFVLIGLCAGQLAGPIGDKYAYPIHSWSWWSVRALRNLATPAPNTVLLGSSLMVVAMAETDATWSGKRIDLTTYRGARYFDSVMNREVAFDQEIRTVNLASPGQIPSDAYLTLKEAQNEGVRPNLVVYGVAPRDFFDSTLSSPFDTECYRYLTRLVSAAELETDLNDGFFQTVTRTTTSLLPFSRQSVDLRMQASDTVSHWNKQLGKQLALQEMTLEQRMQLLSTYEPLDMVPGFIHAEVAHREDVEKLYRENLDDYKARYRKPKMSFYTGQMSCFEKLISLCKENKINLVVVNMPIRECNATLLAPELLQRYIDDLRNTCAARHVPFHDLCDYNSHPKSDFRDSVHLNGFGGKKLIDRLVERLR